MTVKGPVDKTPLTFTDDDWETMLCVRSGKPSPKRTIERLVKRQFLELTPKPGEKGGYDVRLTAAGEAKLRAYDEHKKFERQVDATAKEQDERYTKMLGEAPKLPDGSPADLRPGLKG
jgi:hypothetical protein